MEANSVDSIVTDPPYEYGFMGKAWDSTGVAFDRATWAACLRVLKPGGHLLSFGSTRTYHRIACAIEDAGFEIRDTIAWMFGSGFPKSLDVSKAIDKDAGATRVRNLVATRQGNVTRRGEGDQGSTYGDSHGGFRDESIPATPDAARWSGWGTALKPAYEPIIVARKPLGMNVAVCVLRHGTGAINVDACRVGIEASGWGGGGSALFEGGLAREGGTARPSVGRWPANVILDDEAGAGLDAQSGTLTNGGQNATSPTHVDRDGLFFGMGKGSARPGNEGGASRFFYCAKADAGERDAGLDDLPMATRAELVDRVEGTAGIENPRAGTGRTSEGRRNTHATVKPIDLMRYLCRLVTPPGGLVLDPFAGSGTTLVAGLLEGFDVVGVEMGTDHACIAWHRCRHWSTRVIAPGAMARAGAERPTSEPANLDLFGAT